MKNTANSKASETSETFSVSDIKHYVREFRSLHGDAHHYVSRSTLENLLDSWIFRQLILRGPGLSQAEAREVHIKMYRAVWPEE